MTGSPVRPRVLVGLFLALLAIALQGVQGEEELGASQVPSEVQCRPYIEKALKDLGTGSLEESSAEVVQGEGTDEDDEASPLNEQNDDPTEADNDDDNDNDNDRDNNDNDDNDGTDQSAKEASLEDDATGENSVEDDRNDVRDSGEDDEPAAVDISEDDVDGNVDVVSSEDNDGNNDGVETVDLTSSESLVGTQSDEVHDDDDDDDDQQKDDKSTEEVDDDGTEEAGEERENDNAEDGNSAEETEDVGEDTNEDDDGPQGESKEGDSEEDKNNADSGDNESAEDKDDDNDKSEEEIVRDDENHSKSVEDGDSGVAEAGDEHSEEDKDGASRESEEKQDDDTQQDDTNADDDDDVKKDVSEDSKEETKEDSKESGKEDSVEEVTKESTEGDEDGAASTESAEGDAKSQESVEETITRDRREVGDETEVEEKVDDEKSSKEGDADDQEKSDAGDEQENTDGSDEDDEVEPTPEEDLIQEIEVPDNLRPREHINQLLKLDEENEEKERAIQKAADIVLRDLKRLYDTAIKPLETLYKYRDLSNRHFGDPEIFSKPLVLFMGPWSGGKSSIVNYLLDNEYKPTALRTGDLQVCIEEPCKRLNGTDVGAEPSPAYFNILMHGEEEEILDGTQLAADWTFSGLQKFGQGMLDRLRGVRLNNKLLEKVNIVEIPGILEIRKQVQRLFPFNDACQWFIDRADIIFLVYDPAKLDVGPETEAILDQLKGREYQTRIILNKADQVKPEELMRVQGALIWNISPLMSSAEPPIMYSTSLWSLPYEAGAPTRLLYAQERAFLRDLRSAIDKRVEHKIASARRFAVRVRNHAKMVDCYLTTYYNHKSFFGNKKDISDKIIENPQDYHIYEGLSTLTNISRYDLPDPDVYKDFFRLNSLYDFQQLSATCTYFRGCPINRLDIAIAYDLPELVGKYKKSVDAALHEGETTPPPS
ncbi:protein starmaker isoform X2 [Athalia rosae]|uniref:protein starmaker isoform X2 n=1 Tax=Athalia rosae TaxID=37344 RepID=UPI002033C5F2|nr:protein starmaker isoform X2 [Athalia rosae]